MLVFVAKFGVTPQLGLQRHLASKGAPTLPKGSQKAPKRSVWGLALESFDFEVPVAPLKLLLAKNMKHARAPR